MSNDIRNTTPTPPAETAQELTVIRLTPPADKARDTNNIGPCRECGNPVIQYAGHFACSKAVEEGCTFTMAIADIEAVVEENVADVILDAIIGGSLTEELMSELLFSTVKEQVTWHDFDHSIYEYYEMQLVKNDAGQWVLQITRDDDELAALAREGFARMCEL